MELTAPIQFNYDVSLGNILLFAVIEGFLFGFLLEKGGFGNAKKLAAQFYFKDLRVYKVLFSAIITALLGIFWLSYLNIIDITQLYVTPTYILPQIIGGILFGFGFVISGLCPGTSCVAVFTGKLDGIAVFFGLFIGIILFGETRPLINNFLFFSFLDDITIYEFLKVNYGLIVFIVVLIGLTTFLLIKKIEKNSIKNNINNIANEN